MQFKKINSLKYFRGGKACQGGGNPRAPPPLYKTLYGVPVLVIYIYKCMYIYLSVNMAISSRRGPRPSILMSSMCKRNRFNAVVQYKLRTVGHYLFCTIPGWVKHILLIKYTLFSSEEDLLLCGCMYSAQRRKEEARV